MAQTKAIVSNLSQTTSKLMLALTSYENLGMVPTYEVVDWNGLIVLPHAFSCLNVCLPRDGGVERILGCLDSRADMIHCNSSQ